MKITSLSSHWRKQIGCFKHSANICSLSFVIVIIFVTFHLDLPSHSSFSYNCCRLSTGLLLSHVTVAFPNCNTIWTMDARQFWPETKFTDIIASQPRWKTRKINHEKFFLTANFSYLHWFTCDCITTSYFHNFSYFHYIRSWMTNYSLICANLQP